MQCRHDRTSLRMKKCGKEVPMETIWACLFWALYVIYRDFVYDCRVMTRQGLSFLMPY